MQRTEDDAREVTRNLLRMLLFLDVVDVVRLEKDGSPVYRVTDKGKALLQYLLSHEEIRP